MSNYTAQDVKKLREATGAGFLDCKNALDEAKGNYEKARQIISRDSEPKRELEEEIKTRKNESAARRKSQYLEDQKTSKIASVESEIANLKREIFEIKREIFEIKKAHNSLIVALEKAAKERSASKQTLMYGTYFVGDFSG